MRRYLLRLLALLLEIKNKEFLSQHEVIACSNFKSVHKFSIRNAISSSQQQLHCGTSWYTLPLNLTPHKLTANPKKRRRFVFVRSSASGRTEEILFTTKEIVTCHQRRHTMQACNVVCRCIGSATKRSLPPHTAPGEKDVLPNALAARRMEPTTEIPEEEANETIRLFVVRNLQKELTGDGKYDILVARRL